MKKKLITAATVGALAIGGVGAVGGGAFAEDGSNSSPPTWVTQALSGLTSRNVITADQQSQVEKALADARPTHEQGNGRPGHGMKHGFKNERLNDLATILNTDVETLRTTLHEGTKSLADLAAEKNISRDSLIDQLVTKQSERLDSAVKEGHVTEEQAGRVKATMEEQVTKMVNAKGSPRSFDDRPHQGGGFGPRSSGANQESGAKNSSTAT